MTYETPGTARTCRRLWHINGYAKMFSKNRQPDLCVHHIRLECPGDRAPSAQKGNSEGRSRPLLGQFPMVNNAMYQHYGFGSPIKTDMQNSVTILT